MLAAMASGLGFVVFVLNPMGVHHYAMGGGLHGKTDQADAELIARMIARQHEKLNPCIPPTPEQRQIDRLLRKPRQ